MSTPKYGDVLRRTYSDSDTYTVMFVKVDETHPDHDGFNGVLLEGGNGYLDTYGGWWNGLRKWEIIDEA